MDACFACATVAGTAAAPGGAIHETDHWLVDHCVGPLGVGTLIVKPKRHVVHVADLHDDETRELGPTLRRAAEVVTTLREPEQVYVTLWSHMDAVPGHIHFVVQPVTRETMAAHGGLHGVRLQVEMFDRKESPPPDAAAAFAEAARDAW